MLQVTALERRYGDFVAVKDVNFTINHGEIVGLLGHNGAGKTTIMKMLSGYLEPCHGSVTIDDTDLQNNLKKIQKNLGYLPENLPIYPEMTVIDYLDYAADLKGIEGHKKHIEIRRVVVETDISEKLTAQISTLSRGYKQRVGVAQAILGNPKLLIMDEPTNGLDPSQTQHMRELIRAVSNHATVILSTHIMQEVEALCDRVLIINDGHLIVDKKMSELKSSNVIALKTDMPLAQVEEKLKAIQSVNKIKVINAKDAPANVYQLTLGTAENQEDICAQIAKIILSNDFNLYALQTVQRDLESLFRDAGQSEIESKEEMTNVA
ncbi:ABC transporter ATP-binding protein [Aliikangiella coralliicola]|uniref:ABC transporter ATP-binding protein n=1 Tax=Aliikangiella coralliicola TaxID=2592383 RepID=A0A545UA44_9GAMM|nr:ABC transporter ATP-binding protein [Aliikangiella coralliicola]TQV86345.1 ABC transporter ATP-binding protein [Aliikangiella coralliicola]